MGSGSSLGKIEETNFLIHNSKYFYWYKIKSYNNKTLRGVMKAVDEMFTLKYLWIVKFSRVYEPD